MLCCIGRIFVDMNIYYDKGMMVGFECLIAYFVI